MTRAVAFSIVFAHATFLAIGDEGTNDTTIYEPPTQKPGVHWSETFDGDVWSRWTQSSKEKYNGKFTVAKRKKEALVGDVGLTVPDAAKHYGASASFAPIQGNEGIPFVVQFEARFEEGLSCGGAYMKLFDRGESKAEDFDNDTPYIIMFGPDKCGGTDKVHFILKHQNPKSGEWEEKHFTETPTVPLGQDTHLYTLIINPDNSVEMQIDGVTKNSGSLLTTMKPPVNPPKEIDDPEDKKPDDWVDEAKIDDPASSKPDDWDEDAPAYILDPAAKMPDGWLEDSPTQIPDPAAKIPEDWDQEEDGDWEAPIIDNPACTVGCGKWEHPKISNPEYKGKWHAPQIDNPEYKGEWGPRQIENPNYFVDETPSILPRINAVGYDLWTMQGGIIFDNIVVATDAEAAKAFADQSFQLRKAIEEKQSPSNRGGMFASAWKTIQDNLIPVAVTALVIFIGSIWLCCRGSDVPPPAKRKKPTNGKQPENGTQNGKENGKENGKSDDNAQAEQKEEDKQEQNDDQPKENETKKEETTEADKEESNDS